MEGLPSISPHNYHHYRKHLIWVSISQHAMASQPLSSPMTKKFALLFLQYIMLQSTCIGYCTPAVFRAFCFPARLVRNSAEGWEQGRNEDTSFNVEGESRGSVFLLVPSRLFLQKPQSSSVTLADEAGVHKTHAACTQLSARQTCSPSATEDVSAQPINVT